MTATKIVSFGAFGLESAALDVAIKLGFQHGGFAPEKVGRYGAKATNRFNLIEQLFESHLVAAKANMHEADGTMFFSQVKPDQNIQHQET